MRRRGDEAAQPPLWVLWGLGAAVVVYLIVTSFAVPDAALDRYTNEVDFDDEEYETEDLDDQVFIHGFTPGPWPDPDGAKIQEFEGTTGHDVAVTSMFVNWSTPFRYAYPNMTHVVLHGSAPMVTWAPHGHTTPEIADGSKPISQADGETRTIDEYVDTWARGVCRLAQESGQPVIMRPMHEMNGGWFTWGTSYEGSDGGQPNSDGSYRAAWTAIHDAFREHCGPEDVPFLWTTNHASVGDGASYMGAYPGDDKVDYVGMDGYNWGNHTDWASWQSFDDLFQEVYCAIAAETDVPVVLPEWASAEKGGDKGEWIRTALEGIHEGRYPQVVGSIYFDHGKYEGESDSDVAWSVDSSEGSLAAYRGGMADLLEDGVAGDGPSVCES